MKNKGITLVALVITIIILLILAGITISQLTGSGLFENARLAEQKSKNAQEKENGILSEYESLINGGYRDNKDYDVELYDEWSTWLHLAGIDNPKQYNEQNIVENKNLMSVLLNSDKAVDYMLKSKYFIMPAVCDSETAVDCIAKNENAKSKLLKNSYFVKRIGQNGFESKFGDFFKKNETATVVNENMICSSDQSTTLINAFNGVIPSVSAGWVGGLFWQPISLEKDSYIGYKFNEPVLLYKFSVTGIGYGQITNQYSFVLQGLSQDGTWENIGEEYTTKFSAVGIHETSEYYVDTNNKHYYGFRIKNNYSTSGNGYEYWFEYPNYCIGIDELQFYCTK